MMGKSLPTWERPRRTSERGTRERRRAVAAPANQGARQTPTRVPPEKSRRHLATPRLATKPPEHTLA